MEEEFNAWYDSEHIPERLSIAGFRSARRWSADTAPGRENISRPTSWILASVDDARVSRSPRGCDALDAALPGEGARFPALGLRADRSRQADPNPAAKALLLVCGEASLENAALPGALQVRHSSL